MNGRCNCCHETETIEVLLGDDVLDYVIEEVVDAVLEVIRLRASIAEWNARA